MKLGILLTNLGTPDAPTPTAVRRYLAEFLSDPRVVSLPRMLWQPLLHGVVLPRRASRTAKNYQKIWDDEKGSPLLFHSQALAQQLQITLQARISYPVQVVLAMRYGSPSLAAGLQQLQDFQINQLLLLPLYPQYSTTTTASTFAAVCDILSKWPQIPYFQALNHYADHADYITALATTIQTHWQKQGESQRLLFSFHGLPQYLIEQGDPYAQQCYETAQRVAEKLKLPTSMWEVVFQSRFGRTTWLQPYCDQTLKKLAREGQKYVDIICPGFAVDCLETLEEIMLRNAALYYQAGGIELRYIPALNASKLQVELLSNIVLEMVD